MEHSPNSLSFRLLRKLTDWVCHYPRLFFFCQMILLGLGIYYTVTGLQFSTDRNDLVGSEKKYHRNFLQFKEEFPGQDDLVAVVESEDMEKNRQFVERLASRLEKETNLFTDVFYKGDLKLLGPKALLFLEEETLVELKKTLQDYKPFIQHFSNATNLNSLFRIINQQFRTAKREQNAENDSLVKAIPALQRILDQAVDSLDRPGIPPSPGINALFNSNEEAERQMYITFDKGRLYLVTARARSEELESKAVRRLRELVAQTQSEVTGVNAAITGEPVLQSDEMRQSQEDTTLATIISLLLIATIFIYSYRETGRPLKATFCLVVGVGFTMAFTTLAVGHLNILTITFAPILMGLAIDFGIHLITRYEEELRHGKNRRLAIEKAMVYTGKGIFTGCFTTAGAFLAMTFTDFKGIQEMGVISGGGLVICLLPMMTILPSLLLRGRQNVIDHHRLTYMEERRARIERIWLERPYTVILISIMGTVLALTQLSKLRFDYNLLNMQTQGIPSVIFERKLIDSTTKSAIFAAVVADNFKQAVELEARIKTLPTVSSVDSIASLLLEDQSRQLELIGDIKQIVNPIQFALIDVDPANLAELDQTLWFLNGYLGLTLKELEKSQEQDLIAAFQSLRKSLVDFRSKITSGDPVRRAAKLGLFQQAFFKDIQDTFAALRNQDDTGRLKVEDLPEALRNRFIGQTGKVLLQVYPKENIWDRDPQERFIRDLRTELDPTDSGKPVITGTPVQLYEYTTLLKDSYVMAAWYALGAIAFLVLLHFRSLTCVFLALLPVGVGSFWAVGIMGWLNIPFNPANIMTLPLVVGIGVTNGIHIINRFAEEQSPSILARSTGKAVLVSALTTIAGFGSLMLAQHRGIASLGQVMSLGTAACMIAALTLLPAILNLRLRGKKKK